jgi:cytosine deaminase
MGTGFASIPAAARYVLANATLPASLLDATELPFVLDGLVRADIVVSNGRFESIAASDSVATAPRVELDGGMVWPCFVDMHTHLDKGHIWPRRPNPNGTFDGALEAAGLDRAANWSAEDVRRRMDFSIRCAYAHGTALIRTHLDSSAPQHAISWPVFDEIRHAWAGRIELQAVALFSIDDARDEAFLASIAATLRKYRGVLGAVTYMVPELDRALERLFALAGELGTDIDFHVDESEDPAARSLRHIAKAALRHRFAGRITVGHCCSLALQPQAEADETLDLVAKARLTVVSLPMCNMYLQDRHPGRTPRWRGVTLLHEMRARGIPVAVASDNTRDPFYAYGDLDMVEVFREATRTRPLDHPFGDWPRAVAAGAAEIVGRPDIGRIAPGRPADLVLFRARSWSEFMARPQSDRTVLRSGRPIDCTLPDYRELDDVIATAS